MATWAKEQCRKNLRKPTNSISLRLARTARHTRVPNARDHGLAPWFAGGGVGAARTVGSHVWPQRSGTSLLDTSPSSISALSSSSISIGCCSRRRPMRERGGPRSRRYAAC